MKGKFSSIGRVTLALVLALTLCMVMAVPVSAAVITDVEPTDITVGPDYTALTGPVLAEETAAEFTIATGGTIILTAPAGFAFDTGSPVTATVTVGDLKLNSTTFETVTPAASTITITVTAISTLASTITYTGIRIKDSDDTSGTTGDLVFSGTAGVIGNAGTLTSIPDVVHHFALVTQGTGTETAGTAFTITVTAQDEFDNMATSYIGAAVSVTFTTTATAAPDGTLVTIPSPQILNFSTTPGIVTATGFILVNATETPDITASDGTYSGTAASITVNPEALAAYTVVPAALSQTAGTPFNVVITAVDEFENPLTGYTPVASYTWTTNAGGTPDISAPLVTGDFAAGVATKAVTLDAVETGVTFTVTDVDTITGTSAGVEVVAGEADYLVVTGDATMTAGGTNELTVTAYDIADNVATGYTGSKTLIFSGPVVAPDATAPTVEGVTMENETTVTFTAGVSSGTNATLIAYKAETTTVDVTDGIIDSTGYALALDVDPATAAQLDTAGPATVTAGEETTAFTVQRQDAYANPVISGETVVGLASDSTGVANKFTATTPSGDAVTDVTIADLASTVDFYYYDEKAGDWTITASSGVLTSADSALTVNPAAIEHYSVTAITSPRVIGAAFPVTIQAQDVFDNNITAGTEENVNIAVTAGGTVTPTTTGTTVAGLVTVNVSLSAITLGQSIIFTGVTSVEDGTSNPFQVVDVGAIHHYVVTAAVDPQVFDTLFTVIIQAKDAAGNDITVGDDIAEDILVTCGLTDANLRVDGATDVTAAGTASVKITLATAQAGQTITFEGVASGATVTTAAFSVYDVIIDLPDVWKLISFPLWISSDSAWIDEPVLVYKAAGSVFSSEVTLADDLKPVEALYVKGGTLGIIFSTAPQGVSAKELVAGWNLISSATSESAQAVLAELHDVANAGTGLTTVVSQGAYNAFSDDFYKDATIWANLELTTLEPSDGYWIHMNAAKTFGVVPVVPVP